MSGSDLRQRLAAMLAADVAGYSRLMALDEGGTVAALDSARSVFAKHIQANRGRVVDMAGDSVLAVFETAAGAVTAALAAQQELNIASTGVPEERRMYFRIGVHLGDLIEKSDGTIYGHGVNIAARLQGLAAPGGITVSDAIHGSVRNRVAAVFEDQGEHTVKNIAEPVRAFRVTPAGQEGKASAPVPGDIDLSRPDGPSIAVLPFDNMSGDAEQEYFTDGMVEEIITALSRLNWLFVIARNSSFTYKGRAVDVRQVAGELGVRYVLEGSVRKAGRRVRITGQLIDAHTGAHMWADRFDGELEDVFDLQDQVAESVVGAIEPRLRKAEIERARRKRPENLQAYDLFLRALPHLNKFRPDDNAMALALLEQAIALDGSYAPALAHAAWCYEQRVVHRYPASRETDAADAVRLARAAIATDSDDPGAIGTAAFVLVMVGRDHDGGLAAARRALKLNANSPAACWTAGWVNVLGGTPEEALPIFERALRLSPADPQAHLILNGIGMAHLLLGRYPEAAATARKSASICADLDVTYWILTAACAHLEQIDEARKALATLLSLAPGTTVSWYQDKLGFKDRSHRNILLDGFRNAGMPE